MKAKKFIGKVTLTILAIIIFQAAGFCQKKYLPGFIIQASGDSLQGFVDYRNWSKDPGLILFKENLNNHHVSYTPLDIKGFGVLDEIYQSAIVETEISSFQTNELSHEPTLNIELDTAFLQTIIAGEKSLYFLIKNGKTQLYIGQDSSYTLLVHKKYLKKTQGKGVIVDFKRYLGQLRIYLNNCPKIQSKLTNIAYSKNALEKLFISYYDCTNAKIEFKNTSEKLKAEVGILTGLSLTKLKFTGNNFDYLTNADYHPSVDVSTGLFLDITPSKLQGKWSLYNEVMISSYEVNGSFMDYENEDSYTNTFTTIGYSYLKINNMLRFKYSLGTINIFSNIGISNGFSIKETNHRRKETKFYSTERTVEDKALTDTRKHEQGLILGLGAILKRYTLETRYEMGNGMSVNNGLKSPTSTYKFLLGYRF